MNVEETSLDDGLLLININDMYEYRKKACEEVNSLFGESWSVKKSIEYVSHETLESEEDNDTDN